VVSSEEKVGRDGDIELTEAVTGSESSTEEAPTEEAPTEEAPTEEAPTEEAPTEGSPGEQPSDPVKQRVLFLCTGNSCRSHMSEGLLRHLAGDRFESLSAGSRPAGYVHPFAVRVMEEIGVDISGQQSKSIDLFVPPAGQAPDLVISVCDNAAKECPTFPDSVVSMHLPFDDPAQADGSEDEKLTVFRHVRDEIKEALERALGLVG